MILSLIKQAGRTRVLEGASFCKKHPPKVEPAEQLKKNASQLKKKRIRLFRNYQFFWGVTCYIML